jgi:transcriptional regulator GlxA family with amidase domain
MLDLLAQRFPSLVVDRDAIFVYEDEMWTSAGVTAGIDLALALVEEDHGRAVAMEVARDLVVYMKRPGSQSQHSGLLRVQASDSPLFDKLHDWILDNLDKSDISVNAMAKRVNMSSRNFARVYKGKTGRSPGKAVELFRIEAARRLLEQSTATLEDIARQCGFGDQDRMRAAFRRYLGVTPTEYRRRFSGDAG